MKKDVAIEEIREARKRISKRFGHNTKALLDHYREMEKLHPEKMLRESSPDENSNSAEDQPKNFPNR